MTLKTTVSRRSASSRSSLLLALGLSLLVLPLSLGCSAGWKNGSDGPQSNQGDPGGGTDGGTSDGGTSDGGTSDGGTSDGGTSDGGTSDGGTTGSADADGDGWSVDDGDCDDGDATVSPGAEELCDGQLNDCNGVLLDGESSDSDGDGALDCEDFCPVQVDISASAGGDGSFASPFQSVQEGINLAGRSGCLQVAVYPGNYAENIDYMGVDADVYSTDGADSTVLDGGGAGSVVTFQSGESSAASLRDFTITGGSAARGGGVFVDTADPTISDNIIRDNSAVGGTNLGGGIYLYDSEATVTDNLIQANSAGLGGIDDGNDGGGVAILYGAPIVSGNQLIDNSAGDGGGLWVVHGQAVIINNLVDGNAADDQGSADADGVFLYGQGGGIDIQTDTADVVVSNNIVTNNSASSHGGGVAVIGYYKAADVADASVINNVIAYNVVDSGGYGAGLAIWGYSAPTVVNNAIVNNDGVGVYTASTYPTFQYNDVYGNSTDYSGSITDPTGTDGNLSVAPRFASVTDDGDGTDDDYRLRSTSELIDAGDPRIVDVDGSVSDIGPFGGAYGAW